ARVARQVAGLLQGAAVGGVDLDEGARHAVADRVRLARQTAAADLHEHVEGPRGLGQLQRLPEHHARGLAAEVILQHAIVDRDLAGTGLQPDTGHRFLAATGGVEGFGNVRHVVQAPAYEENLTGLGCWAACGCSAPAYTLSFL